ncbi:MAG: hypothetical protein A3B44_00785 [Candidatus Levybacteria bacterium RIFCSPLOWO2_01_FULL_38_21]|nr:MAG: hypothetical protein A3B44_00785 [Candidatus Levybacteria bacterium RIFCSPLOWO2_01_FULL_38_21]
MAGKSTSKILPKKPTLKRKYKNGGMIYLQKGYVRKKTGKYVNSHFKTKPDDNIRNNRKYILGY